MSTASCCWLSFNSQYGSVGRTSHSWNNSSHIFHKFTGQTCMTHQQVWFFNVFTHLFFLALGPSTLQSWTSTCSVGPVPRCRGRRDSLRSCRWKRLAGRIDRGPNKIAMGPWGFTWKPTKTDQVKGRSRNGGISGPQLGCLSISGPKHRWICWNSVVNHLILAAPTL